MVKLEIGQTVIVTEDFRGGKPQRGTVVKVGRVWIDVHREGKSWGWRFRLDNQTDGSRIGAPARFYTLEQWAEKQRRDSAMMWLHDQGITVERASPWYGEKIKLATLLGWTAPD